MRAVFEMVLRFLKENPELMITIASMIPAIMNSTAVTNLVTAITDFFKEVAMDIWHEAFEDFKRAKVWARKKAHNTCVKTKRGVRKKIEATVNMLNDSIKAIKAIRKDSACREDKALVVCWSTLIFYGMCLAGFAPFGVWMTAPVMPLATLVFFALTIATIVLIFKANKHREELGLPSLATLVP